jgi:DNA-binding beta-propeller fold protein YncE
MKKRGWMALGLSALATCFLSGGMTLAQAAPPNAGVHFITDVINVEDFAPINGTKWVIGSSLSPFGPNPKGPLYVFNTKKTTASAIDPRHIAVRWDKIRYGACPSVPDMAKLVTHGLGIVPSKGKVRTLYVANHGGRESVETFSIDLQSEGPSWTWIGCVSMPAGTYPDAVAALPNDGMVISSLWNPQDPERLAKLRAGAPVGSLFEWSPRTGIRELEETKVLSGPNGVIASPDGKFVFVAVWSGKAVARIDRSGPKPKVDEVETGFLTDNLRWSPNGRRIYAGGQATSVDTVLACFENTTVVNCPNVPFQIDSLDPKTLTLRPIIPATTLGEMGLGTGAIKVGGNYWISTARSDRIAIVPAGR